MRFALFFGMTSSNYTTEGVSMVIDDRCCGWNAVVLSLDHSVQTPSNRDDIDHESTLSLLVDIVSHAQTIVIADTVVEVVACRSLQM